MKTYSVFYIVKANGHHILRCADIQAETAKDAKAEAKRMERERSGRNAFTPSTTLDGCGDTSWEWVAKANGFSLDELVRMARQPLGFTVR